MLKAPNTNPDVLPTSVVAQGGIWAALGSLLGVIVDLLPSLPLPENVRPWVPLIGAVLGWLAHALIGPPQYHPVPPPKPPTPTDDLDARIAAAVQAAMERAATPAKPTP